MEVNGIGEFERWFVEVTNAEPVLDGGGGFDVANLATSRVFLPGGNSPMGFVLAGRIERDCGCD